MLDSWAGKSGAVVTDICAGIVGALLLMVWIASASAAPQAPGVELGPDHTQQVNPGQIIRYSHTLTNTGTTTDTFLVEGSSTQRWPIELTAGIYPTEALTLSLKVSAQVTASFQVSLTIPPQASGVVEVTFITATSQLNPNVRDTAKDTTVVPCRIQLPLILKRWPPIPYTPALYPIYNADQNNLFSVSWQPAELANTYVLEEATSEAFSNARVVYQDASTSWAVPNPGKTPATYYYRVKARNSWGDSPWSNVEQVVLYPLFVGLNMHSDCTFADCIGRPGRCRRSRFNEVRDCNSLIDADTVRCHTHYSDQAKGENHPNWDGDYSISTGYFKSSSVPIDPSWRWRDPWILPYDWQFSDGQVFWLDDQAFEVSGPHSGSTSSGQAVQYWELVNRDRFLYRDTGDGWKQYVYAGHITLRYDAGNTRLQLYRGVSTRVYHNGEWIDEWIHYSKSLASTNALPDVGLVTEYAECLRALENHLHPTDS